MGVDLTDEATAKKVVVVVAVALVAVAVFVLTRVFGGDDGGGGPGAAPTTASPSGAVTVDPEPASDPPPDPSDTGKAPAAAVKVTKAAVVAYTEFSWKDEHDLVWVDRLAPYATEGVVHGFEETFADDEVFAWQWKTEVVAKKVSRRAEVTSVQVDREASSEQEWVFAVTYQTQQREGGGKWQPPQTQPQVSATVTMTGDGWKVSDLAPAQ